jgi:hypothetical protein
MLCICCVEITGRPAYLRYRVERLKQRLPGARILVGLWSKEDPILNDESLRLSMGANHYTSSLRESLNICLQVEIEATDQQRSRAGKSLAASAP